MLIFHLAAGYTTNHGAAATIQRTKTTTPHAEMQQHDHFVSRRFTSRITTRGTTWEW